MLFQTGLEESQFGLLPIVLSIVSLVVAVFALGWNIYRDVVLKARVKIAFFVGTIPGTGTFLTVSVANQGPGPVQVEMIHGEIEPWWKRRILRQSIEHVYVMVDQTNPLNPRLPHRLKVGDTIKLFLPYNEDCLLRNERIERVGVGDSFGRIHYAPKKQVEAARKQFQKDFGK